MRWRHIPNYSRKNQPIAKSTLSHYHITVVRGNLILGNILVILISFKYILLIFEK